MGFNSAFKGLNPICHLLTLLGAHHIFHISGLSVNSMEISPTLGAHLQSVVQGSPYPLYGPEIHYPSSNIFLITQQSVPFNKDRFSDVSSPVVNICFPFVVVRECVIMPDI